MGEDRSTATYQMEKLRADGGNFLVPAARVTVGKEVLSVSQLVSVQVTLDLDAAASASFSAAAQEELSDVLVCGAPVTVELGYGSSLEKVFYGVIYEIGRQLSDGFTIQVTAMDIKRLMADNLRSGYVWKNTTVSGIFRTIMMENGLEEKNVEAEGRGNTKITEMVQRESDLSFVQRLCRDYGLQFLVYGDQAKLFASPTPEPLLTLTWGEDLLSFSMEEHYVNVCVEVRGRMKNSRAAVRQSQTVASPGAAGSGRRAARQVIELAEIDSDKEVGERLKEEIEKLQESICTGSGSCVGLPQLLPGRYLTLAGLSGNLDGDYYLKSVSHSFGADGFATEFTLGRQAECLYGELQDDRDLPEQERRVPGILLGEVTENWDKEHPGMVKVRLLLGEETKNELEWMPVASPYAGNSYGAYLLPEIGAQVVVAFYMGHAESPVVIGSLWNQQNVLPEGCALENNPLKRLSTKGGSSVEISDEAGKARITVTTKAGHRLEIDDESQRLCVSDKDAKNSMIIDSGKGTLTLAADTRAVISVGGKEILTLEKDRVFLQTDTIGLQAAQKLMLKGQNTSLEGSSTAIRGQSLKAEGDALALKGTASLKAESSGILEAKGTMIKLN